MTDTTKPALYALTPEAHATVVAALRLYQHELGIHTSRAHYEAIRIVATNNGTVTPLTSAQIDTLCLDLNHDGLEFPQAVALFAESSEDSPYVAAALECVREGEIEVDDPAVVSKGDDDGAYVMAWMWVSNSDAGVNDITGDDDPMAGEHCPRCNNALESGQIGLCDSCQDN